MIKSIEDIKKYGIEFNSIYNGNCLEILPLIPNESIDLIVTDPPYFVLGKYMKWDKFTGIDEYLDFTERWLSQCFRVLKNNRACYVFWSQKHLHHFFKLDIDFTINRMLIWHHPNLAKPTRKSYLWTYDPIFYLTKGKPKFDANFLVKENTDVLVYAKPQSNFKGLKKRYHPTGKPVDLIKRLITPTTVSGQVVLDPFMGSGSTLVASKLLNREWIGIEIDRKYCEVALRRLCEII